MNDSLQIITILIAVLTLGISKRNMQKTMGSLNESQKKYYSTVFFKFRLFQYPVLFFTIASGLYITGSFPVPEYSWIILSASSAVAVLWFFHTLYFIQLQKKAGILPEDFLKSFLQDRILLFILILLLMASVLLKLL